MKIEELQRVKSDQDRSIALSIRTSKEKSEFMKKHNISPTKVFNTALEELMRENENGR